MDRQIDAMPAVIQRFYWTTVLRGVGWSGRQKAELSIYPSIYIPPLTSHELCETADTRGHRFLLQDSWAQLSQETQLRWFTNLTRLLPGPLPSLQRFCCWKEPGTEVDTVVQGEGFSLKKKASVDNADIQGMTKLGHDYNTSENKPRRTWCTYHNLALAVRPFWVPFYSEFCLANLKINCWYTQADSISYKSLHNCLLLVLYRYNEHKYIYRYKDGITHLLSDRLLHVNHNRHQKIRPQIVDTGATVRLHRNRKQRLWWDVTIILLSALLKHVCV